MRIGINLLYLIPGKVGGTETYARELISTIEQYLQKGDKLILYCGRESAPTFIESDKLVIVTLPLYSENRLARLIFEQTLLPIKLIQDKIDVIFSLGYTAPFMHSCPSVVTIHDLNWYYHPEDFTFINRLAWRWMTVYSIKSSTQIISISSSTALSLNKILQVPRDKITTILLGSSNVSKQTTRQSYKSLAKLGVKKPYLFSVLAGYPHKNLISLLQAFNRLKRQYPELSLVVCGLGGRSDASNALFISSNKLNKSVKMVGYVHDADLNSLYQEAEVFVFPSAYEGFGIPVIEAMTHELPVVSSNAFSLQEVVGDGGILVDPYDVDGYVRAITKLLESPIERSNWIKRGKKRASELKWEDTAQSTLELLKKVSQT